MFKIPIMKLKLILIFITSFSLMDLTNAQESPKKASYLIGGSFNYSSQKNYSPLFNSNFISNRGVIYFNSTSDSRERNFVLLPYFGKVISDKWLVGLSANVGIGNSKVDYVTSFPSGDLVNFKSDLREYGLVFFGRYILNPTQKFNIFLQPSIGYFLLNEIEEENNQKVNELKAKTFEIATRIGVLYSINDKWNVTMRMGGLEYIKGKWKDYDNTSGKSFSDFNTSFNFYSFYLGFEYKF